MRAQPSDSLRERAADITNDAKTPEDQVRALYNFLSTRTRYVGIDFGIGRYQPHPAEEVFANQYGDCKDKDTFSRRCFVRKVFSRPCADRRRYHTGGGCAFPRRIQPRNHYR